MLPRIFSLFTCTILLCYLPAFAQAQLRCGVEAAEEHGFPASCVDDYIEAGAIPGRRDCVLKCVTMESDLGNYHCSNNCNQYCGSPPCCPEADDEFTMYMPADLSSGAFNSGDVCLTMGNSGLNCVFSPSEPTGTGFGEPHEKDCTCTNGQLSCPESVVAEFKTSGGGQCDAPVGSVEGYQMRPMAPAFVAEGYCAAPEEDSVDEAKSLGEQCGTEGNPCTLSTGNKFQSEIDYSSARGDLVLARYYNSRSQEQIGFGVGWTTSISRRLLIEQSGLFLRVLEADGRSEPWRKQDGVWRGDPDTQLLLTESDAGFELLRPDATREFYDPKGKLLSEVSPSGPTTTYRYDASGNLEAVVGPFGRALALRYDSHGRVSRILDPAGGTFDYLYDSDDRLIAVHYPDGSRRAYIYDDPVNLYALTGLVDEDGGRFATWAYDSQNRVISSEHANGLERVEFSYNDDGSVDGIAAGGAQRRYQFQLIHGVRRVRHIEGDTCDSCDTANIRGIDYDENGHAVEVEDAGGNKTSYERDTRGLPTLIVEAVGAPAERHKEISWHDEFRLPVSVTVAKRTTRYTYDERGLLLEQAITDSETGETRTWRYQYSDQGLLVRLDGPREDADDVQTLEYDDEGNLIAVANTAGHRVKFLEHNPHGQPTKIIEENGTVVQLSYDSRQRLTNRMTEDAETLYEYTTSGRLRSITGPTGVRREFKYDAGGRLIRVVEADGSFIEYSLDRSGNPVAVQIRDQTGAVVYQLAQEYDRLNRLRQTATGEGLVQTFVYDEQGNVVQLGDGKGLADVYKLDALYRRATHIDRGLGELHYEYDALDRLVNIVDPEGHSTSYRYNAFGDLLRLQSPDTGLSNYSYDAAGNRIQSVDARGIVLNVSYDVLDRPMSLTFPESPDDEVHYEYDSVVGGNAGIGRLTGITDSTGSISRHYDVQGRVVRERRTVHGVISDTSYGYNGGGQLAELTYPSGRRVHVEYDAAGQISQILTAPHNKAALESVAGNLTYQPFGPLKSMSYGNGLATTFEHALDYRLMAINSNVLALDYEYDANGNVIRESDGSQPAGEQHFQYDELDRLVGARGPYGALSYGYDSAGNRLSKTKTSVGDESTDEYRYSSVGHGLESVERTVGGVSEFVREFSYSAAGSLERDVSPTRVREYHYNAHNRIVAVAHDGQALASYAYNALGQRVWEQRNGPGSLDDEDLQFLRDRIDNLQEQSEQATQTLASLKRRIEALRDDLIKYPAFLRPLVARYLALLERSLVKQESLATKILQELRELKAELTEAAGSSAVEKIVHYDLQGRRLGEYQSDGSPLREYIYLGWHPLAIIDYQSDAGGQLYYLHNDRLGVPRVATDGDKKIVWRAGYLPFGQTLEESNNTLTLETRFPGQFLDQATELHYNYFRDYDPALGRYLQSDPIGLAGGINTYAYAGANPLSSIDPYGLTEIDLGNGYTGRIDRFSYQGDASHEIHVYDSKGRELGVHGPEGWINKHGHKGVPDGLPQSVQDQVKGSTIDELRKADRFPPKGSVNIKGNLWKCFVKFGGSAAVVGNIHSNLSIERLCGMDPANDACGGPSVLE